MVTWNHNLMILQIANNIIERQIMKRILVLFLLFTGMSSLYAQTIPQWVMTTPKPANDTYLYIVERGVGYTEMEARNRAMGLVYRSTVERLSLAIDLSSINSAITNGSNYGEISEAMNMPVNKVCEHIQREGNHYVVYVLCQVARYGNMAYYFTPFTQCNQLAKSQYIGHSFVPGLAQIKKGSVGKGTAFILSEVVLVGGVVAAECLQRYYARQISMTHHTALQQKYAQYANICNITRNVCIGGVAAVYVWNVIDGIVAKGNTQIPLGTAQLRLTPYADYESGGIAAVVKF